MGQKLLATRSSVRALALAAALVAALVITASPASTASNFKVTCSTSDTVATWSGGGVKLVVVEWTLGINQLETNSTAPTGRGSADLGPNPDISGWTATVTFEGAKARVLGTASNSCT